LKVAVITGVEGQDGSWLSEYLLDLGYKVIGITRRKSSVYEANNLDSVIRDPNFKLEKGDITEAAFITNILQWHKPDEYYNLAAHSHVGQSFKEPSVTFQNNATSVIIALDAIRLNSPRTKFYQASTSELFGTSPCPEDGHTEESSFHPRSPYGVAKLAAFYAVVNYREAYNTFACNGILFNHSSTRRGFDFATRKITRGVANIVKGKQETLKMGNMDAFRDEGHAKDYIRAMHLMLQQDHAEDYVVATGTGATIKDMLEYVCSLAGLDYDDVYELNPEFMRPSDVPYLKGNTSKISKLGWKPEYDWKKLLKEMYDHDLETV